jgi:exonuclease SbcC
VRLQRLRLVNFRQHTDTDLEFGPGITGIIGPNGAGKSTLLEAIGWAIYGMEAARGGRDSIRWRRARPRSEVRVELEFGLGAHEYRVVRTLFNAELYLDGGPQPIVTSLSEVSARLARVLGMTHDEFRNTYFTGQRDLAVMAELTPADRRRFLNRLLGYEKLTLAQKLARERRNEMNGELTGIQQGAPDPAALAAERARRSAQAEEAAQRLASAEEAQAEARAASDQHLPVFRELKEFRERHLALTADRRVTEEQLRQAVELVRRLEGEHAEAAAAQGELERLAPQLAAYAREKAALAELELLARDADTRARLEAQLEELARRQEELRTRLEAARAAAAAARAIAERLEATRREWEAAELACREQDEAWVREKADADATRRSLLEQYHDLETQQERVTAAGPEGACPTCGRPLGEEYHAVLELLRAQLEAVTQNGRYYRSRLDQLQMPPADLVALDLRRHHFAAAVESGAQELAVAKRSADEAIALEKQRQQLEGRRTQLLAAAAALRTGYDRERHDTVRRAVAELEPAALRAQRLAAAAERAPRLAAELRAAEERRAALVEILARLQRELDALQFNEEAFLLAEREMQRLERAWQDAERDVAVAQAELGAAQAQLREAERREQEAAARAARVAELKVLVRLHNELDRALGDLSTDLNNEIGPEIATLASEFLAVLTDGQYDELTLDDEFNATVLEGGEPQPVISGGEEDLRDLVLRLAVSQMIADRAGQPLSLLVLDEIFGSLDEAHRAHVVSLLRGLEARFPQVLLITHVEGVRESLDRVLRVRYDEGTGAATVTEERGPPLVPGGADADVAA